MDKYFGKVGYALDEETSPGIWEQKIVEKDYYGDVVRNLRRVDSNTDVNGEVTLSNSISIMADAFAYEHFFKIRYVQWLGVKWAVTNIEVKRPRLILTVGGEYHAEQSDE